MKIRKQDASNLITLLVLIGTLLFICVCYEGTKLVNPFWIALTVVGLQLFYLTPQITKYYYSINKIHANVGRFIPIWNEMMIFPTSIALLCMISWGVLLLSVGILAIKPAVFAAVLGEKILLNWDVFGFRAVLIAVVFNNVIRGIGFVSVKRSITRLCLLHFGGRNMLTIITTVTHYVLCFVPIGRIISMFMMYLDTIKLYKFNQIVVDTQVQATLKEVHKGELY